jgi:magnesium-transporting ATPase (P-type)
MHRIVESLKLKPNRGFKGVGVNDAPALKAAVIGVAWVSMLQIDKGNRDMVLTDDNSQALLMRCGRTLSF